jgi:hypothetical protein
MVKETTSMHTFVILARGKSVAQSQTVAITVNPFLVGYVARKLLHENPEWGHAAESSDPVLKPLRRGRRQSLDVVIRQSEQDAPSGLAEKA